MNAGLRLTEGAVFAAWLTTVAATYPAPDIHFDDSGRILLASAAATPMDPVKDSGPPTEPPNIQCPC
jgi:hypothetical protein